MICRSFFSTTAALTLALSPVAALAQDAETEETAAIADGDMGEDVLAEMFGALGEMFAVEPLTDGQNARLPLATSIVDKMIPAGSMAEMMDNMMGGTLGPIMEMAGDAGPKQKLAERLGITAFELSNVGEDDAAQLLEVFDPSWKARQAREAELMPKVMGEIMTVMEPPMKRAMSELYAINFSDNELGEIDAFFSTETGANFARKSFTMAADPRIMGATMESLPQLMGAMASIETRMAEATADLGPARTFDQLSSDEKAFVSEVTGMSVDDIEFSAMTSMEVMDAAEAAAEEAAEAAVE